MIEELDNAKRTVLKQYPDAEASLGLFYGWVLIGYDNVVIAQGETPFEAWINAAKEVEEEIQWQ